MCLSTWSIHATGVRVGARRWLKVAFGPRPWLEVEGTRGNVTACASTFSSAMLDITVEPNRVTALTVSVTRYGTRRLLRAPRGIAVVFLIVAYLLSGALHQFLDVDVTAPGGSFAVSMSSTKDADTSGKGVAAENHCHGCFSVSVPTPAPASAMIEPKAAAIPQPLSDGSDLVPGIDTPPPKLLT